VENGLGWPGWLARSVERCLAGSSGKYPKQPKAPAGARLGKAREQVSSYQKDGVTDVTDRAESFLGTSWEEQPPVLPCTPFLILDRQVFYLVIPRDFTLGSLSYPVVARLISDRHMSNDAPTRTVSIIPTSAIDRAIREMQNSPKSIAAIRDNSQVFYKI
jgi:hypothetical protein